MSKTAELERTPGECSKNPGCKRAGKDTACASYDPPLWIFTVKTLREVEAADRTGGAQCRRCHHAAACHHGTIVVRWREKRKDEVRWELDANGNFVDPDEVDQSQSKLEIR